MPCRSPLQQVSVATQPSSSPAFLSMSQQSQQLQLNMAPNGGGGSQQSQQGSQPKKSGLVARSGYNEKAMAEIRNSLRPFEQADQPFKQPSNTNGVYSDTVYKDIQALMNMGFDEESCHRALTQNGGQKHLAMDTLLRMHALDIQNNDVVNDLASMGRPSGLTARNVAAHRSKPEYTNGHHALHRTSPALNPQHRSESPSSITNGAPPALPPRSKNLIVEPPKVPPSHASTNGDHSTISRKYSPNQQNGGVADIPPPIPQRREAPKPNPPPTPPRGTTPPPTSLVTQYSNSPIATTLPPPLQKRMSPVPNQYSRSHQGGMIVASSAFQRGTSPVTTGNPVKGVHYQQLLNPTSSIFGPDNVNPVNAEPPPPYPMGSAVNTNPPPSYQQTLATMRQSPTLSSTSSDYSCIRRSPAPTIGAPPSHLIAAYHQQIHGPSPIPASPSPSTNSLLSASSRASSSVQALTSRQIKTQSPVIMNTVKSKQVQKPVLQTATAVDSAIANVVMPSIAKPLTKMQQVPECPTPPLTGSGVPAPPPPSYEISIQQKQLNSPITVPRTISPAITQQPVSGARLPSPPPYPSSQVQMKQELVKSQPVINTAKVVKPVLQRKYSPLTSETASSSASRSESPISDSQQTTISLENTVSCSPLSFQENTLTQDSGFDQSSVSVSHGSHGGSLMPPPPPPPYKTTHHTSPKPERRTISPAKEDVRKSYIKNCPSQAFKFYMEQHYDPNDGKVWREYKERKARQETLKLQLQSHQKSDEIPYDREELVKCMQKLETNFLRIRRAKWKRNDFQKIKVIGLGAFGEVSLVKRKDLSSNSNAKTLRNFRSNLYAMKTLKKSQVVRKNQVAHVMAEKDILAEANNDWIVKLHGAFQDKENLYFVMEYVPGGDLMSKLIKDEKFSEDLARFYIAELTCAVESVHAMGFIHRDIKPDNILIDREGHLKLTDFGLCTGFRWTHNTNLYKHNGNSYHFRQDSMDPGSMNLDAGQCSCTQYANHGMKPLERRKQRRQQLDRCKAHSLVGTPNYIAPEVLLSRGGPSPDGGYNQTCDWWSVGVIFYEMIVGRPPFMHENTVNTQQMVIYWREYLHIPENEISSEAADLIRGLIRDAGNRLGSGPDGANEVKRHPFFNGMEFNGIRNIEAPWKPPLKHDEDTSNFDLPDMPERSEEHIDDLDNDDSNEYNNFAGFTFKRFVLNGGPDPAFFEGTSQTSSKTSNSSSGAHSSQHQSSAPDAVYV